jgi:hypothetical protein
MPTLWSATQLFQWFKCRFVRSPRGVAADVKGGSPNRTLCPSRSSRSQKNACPDREIIGNQLFLKCSTNSDFQQAKCDNLLKMR